MPMFPKAEDILGMSQDDFKKKLEGSASKADLDALKGEISQQFTSSVELLKAELQKLGQKPPEPVVETDPEDPTTAVLTDPAGFIDRRTQPLVNAQLQSNAQIQEMRARQDPRFSRIFAKYGPELVAIADKMDMKGRGTPGFWEWHIKTFLGDKYVKGDLQGESYPSLIGTSSVGPEAGGDGDDPNKGMNPQVAAWLKERGVPLDKAAKINNMMNRDGDPISLQNYKAGNA
jgi:hypothetical protein